jgi:hypothetical protein
VKAMKVRGDHDSMYILRLAASLQGWGIYKATNSQTGGHPLQNDWSAPGVASSGVGHNDLHNAATASNTHFWV